jgi:HPt (histidine-containing phosphotransfer) domain-containing protein
MDVSHELKEYIDVDAALKRIGGNMGLYKRLLGRFVDGNHLDELDGAIKSGDTEEASRMTHTIKGVSANLSLDKIMSVSSELEQLLKAGNDCSDCYSELRQVYGATLEKIEELMK